MSLCVIYHLRELCGGHDLFVWLLQVLDLVYNNNVNNVLVCVYIFTYIGMSVTVLCCRIVLIVETTIVNCSGAVIYIFFVMFL